MEEDQISLREYFERLLQERENKLNERWRAQEEAISKAETSLASVLQGFPQEYAKVKAVEEIEKALDGIRADHVQRREVDDVKTELAVQSGRRTVLMVVVSAALTLSVVVLGFFITDRSNFQSQVNNLEQEHHRQEIELVILQDKIRTLEAKK